MLWMCNTTLASIATLLSQASVTTAPAGAATQPVSGTRPGWLGLLETPLFPLMIGIIILYLFVFRGKKQQDRKRQDMLNQLKRGDRVQTIGGILGTVIEARESEVVVKVDESSNTKMRFTRSAIHRVLDEDGKAEAAK